MSKLNLLKIDQVMILDMQLIVKKSKKNLKLETKKNFQKD